MDAASLAKWFQSIPVDEAESIKLDFAANLDRAIRSQNLARKDVAARLDASPAWVTKVLRGDINLTIESMAKLASSVGYDLNISITKKVEHNTSNVFLDDDAPSQAKNSPASCPPSIDAPNPVRASRKKAASPQ
ncbi:MAG: XRE family transcriptional regulator [Burkholderiaceae bacterium]|nr:XRE family transcriptional regulator [Burkholderiaceae bacterium]